MGNPPEEMRGITMSTDVQDMIFATPLPQTLETGPDHEAGQATPPAASPAPVAPEGDRATRRKWDKTKGMAKKSWSQLTEADFVRAEGSIEKLYDVIHEKVGGAREAIKARLDKLVA
jgi:uncharacterized protein YjbJ (UPF0337 family)